jgi:hypothetical protein
MESKIISIVGMVAGWVLSALALAAWIGKLGNRVDKCEKDVNDLSNAVTLPQCIERMDAIKSNSNLQFNHAAERQIEIKKLLQEQNEAVLLLNEQNERRLAKVQELAEERFDRLVGLLVKNIENNK